MAHKYSKFKNKNIPYHGTKNIIRDEDEQQKRVNTLIFVLKYITRLAGFELLNRIEIKDRKTGREYR